MLKKIARVKWAILAWGLPLIASAAAALTLTDELKTTLESIRTILNVVIGIVMILLTIYFIWGIVQYVSAGGDEEKLKQGKQHMIWGIIGLAVAGAAWGIAALVWQQFGITGGGGNIPIPTLTQ